MSITDILDITWDHCWWASGPETTALAYADTAQVTNFKDEDGTADFATNPDARWPTWDAAVPGLNGKPALWWTNDGASSLRYMTNTFTEIPQPYTTVSVSLCPTFNSIGTIYDGWHNTLNKAAVAIPLPGVNGGDPHYAHWDWYGGAAGRTGFYNPRVPGSNGARIIIMEHNDAQSRCWINGQLAFTVGGPYQTTQSTDTAPGTNSLAGFTLGAKATGQAGYNREGHIALLAVKSGTLTDVQRADIFEWSASFYGTPNYQPRRTKHILYKSGRGTAGVYTFPTNSMPSAGDLIVVRAGTSTGGAGSLACSGYTKRVSQVSGTRECAIFDKISDGTETSVTVTGGTVVQMMVDVYEGTPVSVFDVANSGTITAASTAAVAFSGGGTTQNETLCVGVFISQDAVTNTTGDGSYFTNNTWDMQIDTSGAAISTMTFDRLATATGTQAGTLNLPSSETGAWAVASYKATTTALPLSGLDVSLHLNDLKARQLAAWQAIDPANRQGKGVYLEEQFLGEGSPSYTGEQATATSKRAAMEEIKGSALTAKHLNDAEREFWRNA